MAIASPTAVIAICLLASAHGLSTAPRNPTKETTPHGVDSKKTLTRTRRRVASCKATPHAKTHPELSRRSAIVATAALFCPATALATPEAPQSLAIAAEGPVERVALLNAIAAKASDDVVADLVSKLETLDPSKQTGATAPELGGRWELIYSVNAEAFSPLLNLPEPVRPTSLQLLGEDAAVEVGRGRVAQVLNFPLMPFSLVLSSGAVPVSTDATTLEIFPPFRLEAVWGDNRLRGAGVRGEGIGSRIKLVESGSDAGFRALNARDEDAQAAARNMYKQRYLETTGKRGDLRISEIVSGDPVIVGVLFVHRRL